MDFNVWLAFASVTVTLLLMPGPTVLLVLGYALHGGRRVVPATVAGVAFGHLLAMSVSLAGVGALLLSSPGLFTLLRAAGLAYLVYLGLKLLRSARHPSLGYPTERPPASLRKVFVHTAAVTMLNPKSILFFIAVVPSFLDPSVRLGTQFALLVATFVGLAALNAFAYAFVVGQLFRRISLQSSLPALARVGGGALLVIAAGAAMALFR